MPGDRPPILSAASDHDWPAAAALLNAHHLPLAGALEHLPNFILARNGAGVHGVVGLERYGETALLRSLAVADTGQGLGIALVHAALDAARAAGVKQVAALTTTAAAFFTRFGFRTVTRDDVPAAAHASAEFQGACPDSATALLLDLGALQLAPLTAADWPAVAAIHQQGIETGHATFARETAPGWETFREGKLAGCSLVSREQGKIVGWATLSPTSKRAVYAGVVEVSVYVATAAAGHGVGSALLAALIETAEARGLWTMWASIFPENTGSLALHAKHGFKTLCRRERIGRMDHGPLAGHWRDTLLLERRSTRVGLE